MYSVHVDAQKRKNREQRRFMEQMDDTKFKSTFQLTRQRKALIKKIILGVVILITVVKVWNYMHVTQPTKKDVRPPPPPQKWQKAEKVSKWVYEDNAQGLTEKGLQSLIDSITNGEKIESGRTIHEQEAQTIKKMENYPLKKVAKPYRSTGSLTFKGGKFYLAGNEFRILSGAMHYFRVMPEYWQDRMRKMKACGLNTLET